MPRPIKFLLVDDTPENIVALEALLRRDGLEILTASSGAEALELLLVHDISLAMLDVQMPAMDGFELAELMRGTERTRHVPIIFVTAGARDASRVFKGYDAGAVDFLFKPIDPHILKTKADVFFELARERRQAAEALRLNEMFVAILGHDLRNPLAALIAGAEILQLQVVDPGQQRTLGRMTAATRRMTEMIEQMLDLTRARLAGGIGFSGELAPVVIRDLIERTREELHATTPDREIAVASRGDSAMTGNASRLLQLFSNLLSNAIRHGDRTLPISVIVGGDDRQIVIDIRNGGAIPIEVLPTVFDPFRGRDTHSARPAGLGLGLYISQQIARAHGGEITVDSSIERGTTFTVRLPRHAPPPRR